MSEHMPIARSPIAPAPPASTIAGWTVSTRHSDAALTLGDHTPRTKVHVRANEDGHVARTLGAGHGRATRDEQGNLVAGAGPGEWLVLGPVGTAPALVERLEADTAPARAGGELVTIMDLSHGRALVRLTGDRAPDVLAKVCGIDLDDAVTPDGAALRTLVARLVTDIIRDDRDGVRSYLLHCETSSGQYLFDTLLDAGTEFGIDVDGFRP